TVRVKRECVAGVQFENRFNEMGFFHQAKWRRRRCDSLGAASESCDEERGMPRADDGGFSRSWIKRHAHRAHKRASTENSAEIVINRFHHRGWLLFLFTPMVKQKFSQ